MKIVLLSNPRSGRGTGAAVAADLGERLRRAGHEVSPLAAGRELDPAVFRAALRGNDLLVVAGGDGTLHHALPAIIETGIKFYHFPLGTENLFTREFLMDRRPETLLHAIAGGQVRSCDAASCNGRCFGLMASMGFDACVVERVANERSGGVTRGAYVRHAIKELLHPRIPIFTIRVDDRPIVERVQGLLVIANSRQYAARLDPAREASMSDGQLDVVFYPHASALGLARWMLATAAGAHVSMKDLITARGTHISIEMDGPWPHQIDGEAAGLAPKLAMSEGYGFEVRVLPGVLQVLVP